MSTSAPVTEALTIGGADGNTNIFQKILRTQAFRIFIVLMGIVAVFAVIAPDTFGQWSNFRLIIQNASILAVLGVGMTFVIITAGIDLSIGSVLVFSGVVSAMAMRAIGGDGWGVATVGIIVAVGSGLAWGIFNGILIAKAKIPPLIVTLGSLGMALGLALIITEGINIRDVPPVLTTNIGYGNVFGSVPIISVIALGIVALGVFLLNFTKFGLYTFAVGSSEVSARRVGVNVDLQLIKVYGLAGGLAGFAGLLSLAQFSTTAIAGQSQTNLNVIAGVVIGGTSLFGGIGTIFGTVVGLFIPAVLQNGFVITGVQPFWQQVAVGAVLIIAVYIDQARRAAAMRGSKQSLWRKLVSGAQKSQD